MLKRKMVQCATRVNRDAVRRESIDGVEHVIVSSFTLPDNVVMNGGLYPAEEIAASFKSLERTLSPVEHPQNSSGNYISASDPEAIHNFHAGAFNTNVTRKDGRVHIEKVINVQEAMKTDRGKRLMDRIEELETNDKPRPVHTSVGVFLEVEELKAAKQNNLGQEYTWIARNMFFDHDAILLDSVGAAQPDQGVGMAVNSEGDEINAERVLIDQPEATKGQPTRAVTNDMRTNADGPSFASVMDELQIAIRGVVAADWIWLADVFDNEAIFETNQGYFSVPWSMSAGHVELAGIPIRVDRLVSYQPKVNARSGDMITSQMIINELGRLGIKINGALADRLNALLNQRSEDDDERSDLIDRMASAAGIERGTVLQILRGDIETPPEDRLRGFAEVLGVSLESLKNLVDNNKGDEKMFKEIVLNALTKAGIPTDGLSDEQLVERYNELSPEGGGNSEAIALAVTNAVKPLIKQVTALTAKVNAADEAEVANLIKTVINSKKFDGLDEEGAKALPLETLKTMAASCGTAHGVPFSVNDGGTGDETFAAPSDMPE